MKTALIAAGLASITLFRATAVEPTMPFASATNVLHPSIIRILQEANGVRAFRVEPFRDPTRRGKEFGGHPVLKESSQTNATFAKTVAAALLAEEKYSPGGTTKCSFLPAVGFLIGKDTNSVQVLVCFQCSEVLITSEREQNHHFLRFDTSREQLVQVAKQAFPGDDLFKKVEQTSPFE